MTNWYEVLGVDQTAGLWDCENAYQTLLDRAYEADDQETITLLIRAIKARRRLQVKELEMEAVRKTIIAQGKSEVPLLAATIRDSGKTWYETLGVSENASLTDAEIAYDSQIKSLNRDDDPELFSNLVTAIEMARIISTTNRKTGVNKGPARPQRRKRSIFQDNHGFDDDKDPTSTSAFTYWLLCAIVFALCVMFMFLYGLPNESRIKFF